MADHEFPPPYAVRDPGPENARPVQSPPSFEEAAESSTAAADIGQAVQSIVLRLENLEREAPSITGADYFNIRPPRISKRYPIAVHAMTIEPTSTPEHLKYPGQPFRDRDVNEYDWMTFLNYCFMEDTLNCVRTGSPVIMEKGRPVDRATPRSVSIDKIKPKNGTEDAERRAKLVATIGDWNQGFFGPRGIRVRVSIIRPSNFAQNVSVDVNAKPYGGETTLYKAVEVGDLETTRYLLSRGADPNIFTSGVKSPLYNACLKLFDNSGSFWTSRETAEQREILYLLLAHGANVDAKPRCKGSALHLAAKRKEHKLVSLLIKWGANVDSKPYGGPSALHEAAKNGDYEMAHILIEAGADTEDKPIAGPTALQAAVKRGDRQMLEFLIEHNAAVEGEKIRTEGGIPVIMAVESGDIQMLRILLSHGANPDRMGYHNTALHVAIQKDRIDLARTLLEWGADPMKTNLGQKTALAAAVDKGQLELVREMLKDGGDTRITSAGSS